MPPRPRTDSIRNPATSVPMRVDAAISRGTPIIRPSAAKAQDEGTGPQGSAPYRQDGATALSFHPSPAPSRARIAFAPSMERLRFAPDAAFIPRDELLDGV